MDRIRRMDQSSLRKTVFGFLAIVLFLILGVLVADQFDLFHLRVNERLLQDQELFQRAINRVPEEGELETERIPKVAFMFLAREALPLSPLWDRFFAGHQGLYSVYVHTRPGYQLEVSPSSSFYRREIASQDAQWGDASLTDAERRLLASALLETSNERFVLLSEACIPVYDFPTVYKYLTGTVQSFVQSFDDPGLQGRGRYNYLMQPSITLNHWRKGSQWFEVSRFLARSIISDEKYYSFFKSYCVGSCYPDEHYLPTYVHMYFPNLNANRSVTWVDWSRGGAHPATYGASHINEGLLQAVRSEECSYNDQKTAICFLFARKFAPSSLKPLLDLASKVMGF